MHHTGSQENEVGPEEQEEAQEQEPLWGVRARRGAARVPGS